jgi:Mrp family chromosome partitioning ATPase
MSYTETSIQEAKPAALERNRIVATQLVHPVNDVYRALRAQVLQRLAKLGKSTIGITSVGGDEGKTLTAVNLAIAMSADINHTVLLVDADLRNPGIADCFGVRPEYGLSDYLSGAVSLAECLINPGMQRLSILPSRNRVGNSAELLSSPQMAMLARELKGRYPDRIILYDLPTLLGNGDALGFLPGVETTLLVVREGKARASDVKRAVSLLADHNLIGTVLNAAE